ncbi:hypothetical protein TNMX_08430 [Thermus sp. NMX2.A1]|nr:hypothetical protein TNMX_08430 [Thermus sp. NMX2.A1]
MSLLENRMGLLQQDLKRALNTALHRMVLFFTAILALLTLLRQSRKHSPTIGL